MEMFVDALPFIGVWLGIGITCLVLARVGKNNRFVKKLFY
jgi:hypothetical protein